MAFRFDQLTIKAQEAVQRAAELAQQAGHPQIDPHHLLSALLAEEEGIVAPVLEKSGAERGQLHYDGEAELDRHPKGSGGSTPQVGAVLGKVLEAAKERTGTMKDDFVSTEHLLLALATVDSKAKETLSRWIAHETAHTTREHKLSTCIHRVMPADGPFTVLDLVAALEGLDPTRIWPKRSVERYVSRLRERRVVRRMCRAKGLAPALYVREGVEVPPLPFEDKTLAEVATEVLAARTMSQTELVVAMLEAGYQTSMTRRRLRDAVGVVLRGDRKRFAKRGRQWVTTGVDDYPP